MKKLFLLICTVASSLCAAPKLPTHDLLVMLDYGQSEEALRMGSSSSATIHGTPKSPLASLGAITSTVLPALYQQTAPLVVSRSILYSIMARKKIFHDCVTLDIQQLHKRYGSQNISRAPSLSIFKQHCLYAQRMFAKIQDELRTLFTDGTAKEIDKAINILSSKHPYLEASAPRSLQFYSGNRPIKEAMHRELQAYALCYYAPISTEHFSIKEISQELVLLVPVSYATLSDAAYKPQSTISALEKRLGLKLNHLKDITDTSELLQKTPVTYGVPLAQDLSRVLVTRKEGSTHTWSVYFTGHGLPLYPERRKIEQLEKLKTFYANQTKTKKTAQQKRALTQRQKLVEKELPHTKLRLKHLPATHESIICSISSEEFKRVLRFLHTDIHTSLLFYTSCFAGGEHLVSPYQGDTKILNYDCIVGSVTDAVSSQATPMLLLPPYKSTPHGSEIIVEGITEDSFDTHRKKLTPRSPLNFDQLKKSVRDTLRKPFSIVQSLHPYIKQERLIPDCTQNIALERPAGSSAFNIIGPPSSLYTVPHSGTVPKTADVGFLTQPYYGSLSLQALPSFVSLTPGPAYHVIESLEAPFSLAKIVKAFLKMPSLSTPKLFWIKKLVCTKESVPFLPFDLLRRFVSGSHTVLHNVIIARNILTADAVHSGVSTSVYFSDSQGNTWHVPVKGTLGRSTRTSQALVHGELFSVCPRLRETTLKRQIKLNPDGVRKQGPFSVKAPFNPRANRRIYR